MIIQAARELVEWIDTLDTDGRTIILGDLNSYASEYSVTNITAAGYVDLALRDIGTGAYSYQFGGKVFSTHTHFRCMRVETGSYPKRISFSCFRPNCILSSQI